MHIATFLPTLVIVVACGSTKATGGTADAGDDGAFPDSGSGSGSGSGAGSSGGDCGSCWPAANGGCDCNVFPCGNGYCQYNADFCLVTGSVSSCRPFPTGCNLGDGGDVCACLAASTGLSSCHCPVSYNGAAGEVVSCGAAPADAAVDVAMHAQDAATDASADAVGDAAGDAQSE